MSHRRWVLPWLFFLHLQLGFGGEISSNNYRYNDELNSKDHRGIFSPRMDYDQWKPLGRGDPLKNDPTYDYVPPVLDRVHYWMDPAVRNPDPSLPGEHQKTEILLLGVSSKKPSTGISAADSRKDNYDGFLKFVDGPKFNNNNQRISRPYPLFSSYLPQNFYAKNKNGFNKGSDQRVPYTMLMPPPMFTKKPNIPSATPHNNIPKAITLQQITTNSLPSPIPTTSPPISATFDNIPSQVTIQPSNLIYQSSSIGDLTSERWKNIESSTNLTPVSYTTNKITSFNENIVFQKHLQPPDSFLRVQFAPHQNNLLNSKPLLASNSDYNINFVTPPPLLDQRFMHTGQVSDDNLDISNTYVKIGKTEAQMQAAPPQEMLVFSDQPIIKNITQSPLTLQTLDNMQTMQPPPITTSPVYKKTTNSILAALEKEKVDNEIRTTEKEEEVTTTVTTTTTSAPTTTTTSLTTDPLFKHYKQPAEPLKGPLYLIIQGHSKVKTYGPSKQFHGIRVQETNEIYDDKEVRVKDIHGGSYVKNTDRNRQGRSGPLQTLKHVIQTGLGAIDFNKIKVKDDVHETELQFGYKVGEDVTSEKYHKGIVEEARNLKN